MLQDTWIETKGTKVKVKYFIYILPFLQHFKGSLQPYLEQGLTQHCARLKNVDTFTYLGRCFISECSLNWEVSNRLAQAGVSIGRMWLHVCNIMIKLHCVLMIILRQLSFQCEFLY